MEFSDFAMRLYKIIGGEDQGEFVRSLFLNITSFPENQQDTNIVTKQSSSTFKDYLRGRRSLKTFAWKSKKKN